MEVKFWCFPLTHHTHTLLYILFWPVWDRSCRPLIKVFIFDLSLRYLWGRLDFFFIWGSSAFLQQKTSNSESSEFYTSSLGTSTYLTVFHLYIYIFVQCTYFPVWWKKSPTFCVWIVKRPLCLVFLLIWTPVCLRVHCTSAWSLTSAKSPEVSPGAIQKINQSHLDPQP